MSVCVHGMFWFFSDQCFDVRFPIQTCTKIHFIDEEDLAKRVNISTSAFRLLGNGEPSPSHIHP